MLKQTGQTLLNRFKNTKTEDEVLELETMMMFKVIEFDYIARELRDYTSKEQKREINMFLNSSKRVVNRIEKKYIGDDSELEDVYYDVQDFLIRTTKHQMSTLRSGKIAQFLESIKYL